MRWKINARCECFFDRERSAAKGKIVQIDLQDRERMLGPDESELRETVLALGAMAHAQDTAVQPSRGVAQQVKIAAKRNLFVELVRGVGKLICGTALVV